jgi:hypothetical protein
MSVVTVITSFLWLWVLMAARLQGTGATVEQSSDHGRLIGFEGVLEYFQYGLAALFRKKTLRRWQGNKPLNSPAVGAAQCLTTA